MAREMYLVGVDETELEPPKPPEPPKGFKAKWQNFWYHYKWPVVLGALAVVAVIILVAQMVNREHPDYHMIIASTKNLPVPANDAFAAELEQYGRDLNRDGKVLVSIEFLYVGSDGGQLSAVNQQKFTATMFAGDTLFFGFSPDYYDYLLKTWRIRIPPFSTSSEWRVRAFRRTAAPGVGRAPLFCRTKV